ncbi:MAG: hypothetical protein LLF95_11220 [Bacteroidales bacterium]|nr:hypothetical protein [Bacteroidales bacterium]
MATEKDKLPTQAQIDAEKSEKINQTKSIQPNKADIKEPSLSPEELKNISPANTKTPKESNRQYGKKVQDFNAVIDLAKSKGVDVDNLGKTELLDSDKQKITEAVKAAYPGEVARGVENLSKAYVAPKPESVPKIDMKKQMDLERQKRKIKWADALYAFGEGVQGRTANPENFAQNRIKRKQDQEFQDYKDVISRNAASKYAYENKTRSELMNWADEQSKNEALSAREREKFAEMKRQFEVTAAENKRYHTGMINKKSGEGDKANRPVRIKTSKQTYELKPEEAAFLAREAKKKASLIADKYPQFWVKTQKTDKYRKPIGEPSYTLRPEVSDNDLAAAVLEEQEDLQFKQFEKSKENILENYKQSGELNPEQPTKAKADPLGLGI